MEMTGEQEALAAQAADTDAIVAELLGARQARGDESERRPREAVQADDQLERTGRKPAEPVSDEGAEHDADQSGRDEKEGADAEEETVEEDAEGVADDEGGDEPKGDEEGEHGADDKLDGLSALQLRQRVQALMKAGNLKGALKLATGLDPAAFQINEARYTAFRQHEARERQKTRAQAAKVEADRQRLQGEVQRTVAQLQPYAQFAQAAQAYRQTGDTRHVRAIVEGLMGRPYNEAQKALLHDEKRTPGEQALLGQVQQLQRQLEELKAGGAKQQQQQGAEAQRAADIDYVGGLVKSAGDPELAAIPRVNERIYRVLMKHRHPQLGLQVSFEQAAQMVKRGERERVAKSPFFQKAAKRQAEAPAGAVPRGAGPSPALRRDSRQVTAPVGDENEDDIIRDLQAQYRRRQTA